jgi:hypothetical protein
MDVEEIIELEIDTKPKKYYFAGEFVRNKEKIFRFYEVEQMLSYPYLINVEEIAEKDIPKYKIH